MINIKRTTVFCFLSAAFLVYPAWAGTHVEDFSTTAFRDSGNTTADWNTADGELKLFPFSPTVAGFVNTPGNCRAVEVVGNLAFATDASFGLQIVDISDPTSPTIIGNYSSTVNSQDVALYGDYVYIADSTNGLLVIDVSDPTTPGLAGAYNPIQSIGKVAVSGNLAVVGVSLSGIQILDLANPVAPVLLGTHDTPGIVAELAIEGNLVYVGDASSGVQIVDITNPASPTLAGSFDTAGSAGGVFPDGDLLYVADGSAGLTILDITDPTNPTLLDTIDTPGSADRLTAAGNRVYLTDSTEGLHVIDVSDPTDPFFLFSHDTPGTAVGVAYAGEHVFIADSAEGLQIVRVYDSSPIVELHDASFGGFSTGVTVRGNRAYVAQFNLGLYILDATSASSVSTVLGIYSTPGEAWKVDVVGDLAYVADGLGGIQVIDISDSASPAFVGSYASSDARHITVHGQLAFVADRADGFLVLDISVPATPTLLGSLNPGGTPVAVAFSGSHAFLASTGGTHVMDVSNPASPVSVGFLAGGAFDVAVEGDRLYLARGVVGVTAVDITDPTTPTSLGTYSTGGDVYAVDVSGNILAVADGASAFFLLDVTGATPVLLDSTPTSTIVYDVDLVGDLAYVANSSNDIVVYQVLQDEVAATVATAATSGLPTESDLILRGRVAPSQTSGVSWTLSATNGLLGDPANPGEWIEFSATGTEPAWSATLTWDGSMPVVTEVTLDWLTEGAGITSVEDIPNDQGRQVRVTWDRSGHDFSDAGTPIAQYAVFRAIDPDLSSPAASTSLPATASLDPLVRDHALMMQAAGWDFLVAMPAFLEDRYSVVVPTLADSTIDGGQYQSTFRVTALTATPGLFYHSMPDSGYSLDNLAPAVPLNLVFSEGTLTWDESEALDFDYFTVFGSDAEDPGSFVLIDRSVAPILDVSGAPFAFYFVTATDFAGNHSEAASLANVSSVPGTALKSQLLGAYPNPFNPSTKLSFELAAPSHVRLKIYDPAGRLVTTLVDEARTVGRHEVVWDGRNAAGGFAASGVYLYRFEAGSTVQTKRMTLVK